MYPDSLVASRLIVALSVVVVVGNDLKWTLGMPYSRPVGFIVAMDPSLNFRSSDLFVSLSGWNVAVIEF